MKRVDGAILSNLSVFPASITPKAVVTKLGDKAFALNPSAAARSSSTSGCAGST